MKTITYNKGGTVSVMGIGDIKSGSVFSVQNDIADGLLACNFEETKKKETHKLHNGELITIEEYEKLKKKGVTADVDRREGV